MSRVKTKEAAPKSNRMSVIALRLVAGILVIGSLLILARGYLIIDGHKESGPKMYYIIGISLFWAPILWLWSKRKIKVISKILGQYQTVRHEYSRV
jgi:hypothetical protein